MKKINILLTGLALLMTACAAEDIENISSENQSQPVEADGEWVDVSINVSIDDLKNAGTRDGGDVPADGNNDFAFGKGEKIDMLIYTIRDSVGNILTQYGKGYVDPKLNLVTDTVGIKNKYPALGNYRLDDNDHHQTVILWGETKKEDIDEVGEYLNKNFEIRLRMMRGTVFNISLWAQNSNCTAFDFNKLTELKVDYSKLNLKDKAGEAGPDIYDAFSASADFSVGQVLSPVTVTLTRPFAQINLGIKTDAKDYSDAFTDLKVNFNQVATRFNVKENRVLTPEDAGKIDPITKNSVYTFDADEALTEYTFTSNFTEWGDQTFNVNSEYYKYLGMCYVLVPDPTYNKDEETGDYTDDNATIGDPAIYPSDQYPTEGGIVSPSMTPSTISNVTITVTKNGEEFPRTIENLSVNRNWRTNLLYKKYQFLALSEPIQLETPNFGSDERYKGFTMENDYWNPVADKFTYTIEPIKVENGEDPDPDYYTYEVTYYESEDAPGTPLNVTREYDENGDTQFKCTLPIDDIKELDKNDSSKYPQIKVKAISLAEDIYKFGDDDTEQWMPVKYNWKIHEDDGKTPKSRTWNFVDESKDDLGGFKFRTNIGSIGSITNKTFGEDVDTEVYHGLVASTEENKIINTSGNFLRLNNSDSRCKLSFKVYESCYIKMEFSDGSKDRYVIVDYNVKGYNDKYFPVSKPEDLTSSIDEEGNVFDGCFIIKTQNFQKYGFKIDIDNLREDKLIYLYSGGSALEIKSITLTYPE